MDNKGESFFIGKLFFDPPDSFKKIFSLYISFDQIPSDDPEGISVQVEANRHQAHSLEKVLQVPEIFFFKGSLKISKRIRESGLFLFSIKGDLHYKVLRECVVSGNFFEQTQKDSFQRDFAYGQSHSEALLSDEWLCKDETGIDIGAVCVEEFLLSLPPHPRSSKAMEEGKKIGTQQPFSSLDVLLGKKSS